MAAVKSQKARKNKLQTMDVFLALPVGGGAEQYHEIDGLSNCLPRDTHTNWTGSINTSYWCKQSARGYG